MRLTECRMEANILIIVYNGNQLTSRWMTNSKTKKLINPLMAHIISMKCFCLNSIFVGWSGHDTDKMAVMKYWMGQRHLMEWTQESRHSQAQSPRSWLHRYRSHIRGTRLKALTVTEMDGENCEKEGDSTTWTYLSENSKQNLNNLLLSVCHGNRTWTTPFLNTDRVPPITAGGANGPWLIDAHTFQYA